MWLYVLGSRVTWGFMGLYVLGSRVTWGFMGFYVLGSRVTWGFMGFYVLQEIKAPNEKVCVYEKLGLRSKHLVKVIFVIVEIKFLQKL